MNELTNFCDYNEDHLTQALRLQTRETQRKKNVFLVVLLTLLLGFSLYQWAKYGDTQYLVFALLSVAMGGMLAYANFLLPRRLAKKQEAMIREKNGGLRMSTRFGADGVHVFGPTGEETALVSYGDFRKLTERPDLLLLVTENRQMILLDRARFENGSEAELRALLAEKCPSLEIKQK